MKIAIIGDTHFGQGDIDFLDNQLGFFEKQLVPFCKTRGITTLIFEGDIFHNRKTIDILVKNKVLDLFKATLSDFECIIYLGNHDVYYKNSNQVNSLKFLTGLPNVTVYEEITKVKRWGRNILFVPWLYEETKLTEFKVDPSEVDVMFGHFDIVGSRMNTHRVSDVGLDKKFIFQFPLVFSGHYHTRSEETHGNGVLIYTGTPYQLDRGDKGETKGFYVLETDDLSYEFVVNEVSSRFVDLIYPETVSDVKGNKVDLHVEEEYLDSFEFKEYQESVSNEFPLSVTVKIIDRELGVSGTGEVEIDNKSLEEIFIEYVKTLSYDEATKGTIVDLAFRLLNDEEEG